MTTLAIPANDRDGVRIFTARLSPDDLHRDKARLAAELLGDADLDPAYIEIFDLADLAAVGLAVYLGEGMGIPDTALAADRALLDSLTGPVLILRSKALHGREVALTLDPRLTLVAAYAEEHPPVHFEPLPSAAAQGTLSPTPPPDPTPQRPTAAFLLLWFALLLVGGVALWLALG
jgi:hypothetical protein